MFYKLYVRTSFNIRDLYIQYSVYLQLYPSLLQVNITAFPFRKVFISLVTTGWILWHKLIRFMAAWRKEEADAARHRQEKREATRLGNLLSHTEAY